MRLRWISAAVTALYVSGIVSPAAAILQGASPAQAQAGQALGDLDPEVKKAEEKVKKLQAQFKAKPKDAKLKSSLADALYQAGHTTMLSGALPPRKKYRGALAHFREALKLNPKHKKAADEKKLIEDIYKQMGMPVPN